MKVRLFWFTETFKKSVAYQSYSPILSRMREKKILVQTEDLKYQPKRLHQRLFK